jgi:hypothetical protein
MNDDMREQQIRDAGLTAPRLTPSHVQSRIAKETYYVFPGTTNTVCLLTLKNGFTVTGTSACASMENFNKKIGEEIARENAVQEIWVLEGYLLKDCLHNDKKREAK